MRSDGDMVGPYGGTGMKADSPLLIILEAKRTSTLQLSSSEAEVLGQMRALMQK
jgi:hypothetical protein